MVTAVVTLFDVSANVPLAPLAGAVMVTVATQQLDLVKINFQRALSGSATERRDAFKEVSAQLEALLGRVMDASASGGINKRKHR